MTTKTAVMPIAAPRTMRRCSACAVDAMVRLLRAVGRVGLARACGEQVSVDEDRVVLGAELQVTTNGRRRPLQHRLAVESVKLVLARWRSRPERKRGPVGEDQLRATS